MGTLVGIFAIATLVALVAFLACTVIEIIREDWE